MFERLIERLNKFVSFIRLNVFSFNGYSFIFFIYLIWVFMFFNNLLPKSFVDFTSPDGLEFGNIFSLILTCNFGYVIYIFSFIKYELLDFFINSLNFIFTDNVLNYDLSYINADKMLKKHGFDDLMFFYCLKMTQLKINVKVWLYHYIYVSFFNFFILGFNLPLFFYFGLIYIFTTLISLLLLSYYGFYGVFVLNLISIVFF